jgi:hypothetical protein
MGAFFALCLPEGIFASHESKRAGFLSLLKNDDGQFDGEILQFSRDQAATQELREEAARRFEELITDASRTSSEAKRTVQTLWHPLVTEALRRLAPILTSSFWAWMQATVPDLLLGDSYRLAKITAYSWLDCRQAARLLALNMNWRHMGCFCNCKH